MGTARRGVSVDGAALRRAREAVPLTIRELHRESGVSHNTITNLENSHRNARPSTIRKLASTLGVEPGDLMRRGD